MKENMNDIMQFTERDVGEFCAFPYQCDEDLMWQHYCLEILILSRLEDDKLGEIYKEEALISDLEYFIPSSHQERTGSRCPLV
jgi:hypothetical protein